jgi:hypothetical protein
VARLGCRAIWIGKGVVMPRQKAVDSVDTDGTMERIESEEQDRESAPKKFEVVTYPADFTLEVLWDKWKKRDLVVPEFQRRFVWTPAQSSKLIESFLLGLPVPPIYVYVKRTGGEMLVVDGQQRLKTIAYFFEGYFGEEDQGARQVFKLSGLSEKSPYLGKSYVDLRETDAAAFKRLNDSVLRTFIVKQLHPKDDTSIYHIFERLNTGGTLLQGQEIRNCIYHGNFNDLLLKLNNLREWREIFGKAKLDKRQRDVELILRFFALHFNSGEYEKPMKDFLNDFMGHHQQLPAETITKFRDLFASTVVEVRRRLGPKPFHIHAGLNAAVYDSVLTAFASGLKRIPRDIMARYRSLTRNRTFVKCVTASTTDEEVLRKRLALARRKLFKG